MVLYQFVRDRTAAPPHVTGLPTVAGQAHTSPVTTEKNARIQGPGITPSAKWIAVRGEDGLNVILTDHLGSILGEVDGLGALVGEQRYLPFGEVRGDVGSNPSLDMSFTGQRALVGTGLIDYKARQYDPSLRTFIQPDNVIPDPYDVQDYNRYLYVHANPVNYVDPSGNRPCDDIDKSENCVTYSDQVYIDMYKKTLDNQYGWELEGDWSLKLIETVFNTAKKIEGYVDNLTGGYGRSWMHKYLGSISMSLSSTVRGSNWPADHVTLPSLLRSEGTAFNEYYIAHELGHVWDNSASPSGLGVYIGGGPSDLLNDFTGGEVSRSLHLRFVNPIPTRNDPYVKEPFTSHPFDKKGPYYGNGSTADYFAEAFTLNIFSKGDVPLMASLWVDAIIGSEVAYYFLK